MNGAYAILMGLNPFELLERTQEDYQLHLIMLRKAVELDFEQKKTASEIIGAQIAKVMGAMLGVH